MTVAPDRLIPILFLALFVAWFLRVTGHRHNPPALVAAYRRVLLAVTLTALPFGLVMSLRPDLLAGRTPLYIGILSFLVSGIVGTWVYQRHVAKLPPPPVPEPELHLVPERLPNTVWLALVPPVIVVVVVWWVNANGGDLPWRGGPRPGSVAGYPPFRFLVRSLVLWNTLALWVVGFGVAVWYGMSRAYEFRRTMLRGVTLNQWAVLVSTAALTFSVSFRLPSYGTVACALAAIGGIAVLLYNNRQTLEIYAEHPQLGMVYFDAQDAALMGHRGMNLASAWFWGCSGPASSRSRSPNGC